MATAMPVSICPVFALSIHHLARVALLCIAAGVYLFVRGLLLLIRKRLLVRTPAARIGSVSPGLAELSGVVSGPYTLQAPITDEPCFLYRTIAWQHCESNRDAEWTKIAEENHYVPFFLSDITGQVLVDARGAELDLAQDFCEDFDLSVFSSHQMLPSKVSAFLARHELKPYGSIQIEESIIRPKDALFILGTIANASEAKPFSSPDPATGQIAEADSDGQGAAPQIVRLSDSGAPLTSAEMTLQGRIAAALLKAGISETEARAPARVSDGGAAVQPAPQGRQVRVNDTYHAGQAEDGRDLDLFPLLVMRKGESNPTFLISWRSQQDVIRSLTWKSLAMICGGAGLILVGVYVLLL